VASEGDLLFEVRDFKVILEDLRSWMFTRPRMRTTSPRRRVDDEEVEGGGDGVWVCTAFGKWTVETSSVSEAPVDLDEETEEAFAFLLSAISSSRTFRESQEGEGGIGEYR
jgi:hypothetical protein